MRACAGWRRCTANHAAEREGGAEVAAAAYARVSSPSGGVPLPNLTEHL